MASLKVVERKIPGPEPVEKTLMLNSDSIAVAFIDPTLPECTLTWLLGDGVSLNDVLDSYRFNFLPEYGEKSSRTRLEYWIGDSYFDESLSPGESTVNVLNHIQNQKRGPGDSLELLQLSTSNTTLEAIFDDTTEAPLRIALIISAIYVQPLAKLFFQYHRHPVVRADLHTTELAFHRDSSRWPGSHDMLHPLPVFE